jgi:hypothetical protein
MPNPRVGHCVFCDDIRMEIGNKMSLMGVYSGVILFSGPPPAVMPKFGIVTWIISDRDDVPTKLAISIIAPDGTELAKMEQNDAQLLIPSFHEEDVTKGMLRALIQVTNLPFNTEGLLEVIADTGRETFRAGRLRIRFNVPLEEMGLA